MSLRNCFIRITRYTNKYTNKYTKINPFQLRNSSNDIKKYNKIYTETHEWLLIDKETNKIKIGLSEHAIDSMNELVYIDVDSIDFNEVYNKEALLCEVESIKVVESINCPYDNCKVTDINTDIIEDLDRLNKSPEDSNSWILELEIDKSNSL